MEATTLLPLGTLFDVVLRLSAAPNAPKLAALFEVVAEEEVAGPAVESKLSLLTAISAAVTISEVDSMLAEREGGFDDDFVAIATSLPGVVSVDDDEDGVVGLEGEFVRDNEM